MEILIIIKINSERYCTYRSYIKSSSNNVLIEVENLSIKTKIIRKERNTESLTLGYYTIITKDKNNNYFKF